MPTQKLVITVSQKKRRLLHVPTQRLVTAVSQIKRQPASRAYSKASYCSQPDKKKAASHAYSKASYCSQPDKRRRPHVPTQRLHIVVGQKKRLPRMLTQRLFIVVGQEKRRQLHVSTKRHAIALSHRKKNLLHVHITLLKKSLCAFRRDKYALSEPKSVVKDAYVKDLKSSLLNNPEVKSKLIESFKKQQTVVKRVTGKAVCSVAAKRLVT